MTAAKQLRIVTPDNDEKERQPDQTLQLKGDGRAIAVAKFRELADMLERGELDGARVQWRARNLDELERGAPSEMQTVTVTPRVDDDWHNGTVQLLTFQIEETPSR